MRLINIIAVTAFLSLPATSNTLPTVAENILSISLKEKDSKVEPANLRNEAIAEDAYSWGIQEGAFFRSGIIQKKLKSNSFAFDKMFPFGKFVIDGMMLMPTVAVSHRMFSKENDVGARYVDTSFSLDKEPKIVSQPPSWRDFLIRRTIKPEKPLRSAFPRSAQERDIWVEQFTRGWFRGVKQADAIFSRDLDRLHKYLAGLYEYRFAVAQNILTLPTLSKDKFSVMMLDSGRTINLNDVSYTITMDAQFNQVSEWRPVFDKGDAHAR